MRRVERYETYVPLEALNRELELALGGVAPAAVVLVAWLVIRGRVAVVLFGTAVGVCL